MMLDAGDRSRRPPGKERTAMPPRDDELPEAPATKGKRRSPKAATETGEEKAPNKVTGPARKPIQVIQLKTKAPSFWVFCDDGTVWTASYKRGELRWTEVGDPLPGSPAGRNIQLSVAATPETDSP
jgi:hypothetical protein